MALDRHNRSEVLPSEVNNDPWWVAAVLILLGIPVAVGLIYLLLLVLLPLAQ